MFTYFTEFYKQAVYHFVVSAGCAVLFALGLHYSQGSNGDSSLPYFVPAIVLSTFHFMSTIVAFLSYYFARSLSDIYDTLRRWDNSEKHFRRLKAFYLILQYISFIWSIVGASMAGNSGVCGNKENPCYYTVNKWENRTIAIVIVVSHVINAVITFIICSTRHKIRPENDVTSLNIKRKKIDTTQDLVLSSKPPNFKLKLNTHDSLAQTQTSKTNSSAKKPKPLKKISIISNGLTLNENKECKRNNLLPPLKEPLKRHRTVHGGPLSAADDTYDHNIVTLEKLNRNRSETKRFLKNRNTSLIQTENGALYSGSDDLSHTCNESMIKSRSNRNKENINLIRRMSQHPNEPPPSYNQVIESRDTTPYWIPPEPQHNERLHYLPENMYTGNSYPDTDIVPIQPLKVSKTK